MSLQVELEPRDGVVVVRLIGDGGAGEAADLGRRVEPVFERMPGVVVVDMSGLSFVGSMAMGQLATLKQRVRKAGGHLRAAALQPQVAEAFNTAQLAWIIPTFETVDDALAGL